MRKKGQRIAITAILLVLVISFCIQPLNVFAASSSEDISVASSESLAIKTQPKSVAAPEGATATVKVDATGEGLTYQWYYKNASNKVFHAATDFTTDTYSVPMSSARNGRQLYCVITDQYGNSVKTETVTLYMGNPATITMQPVSVEAPMGSTAKVTLTATGDGLTYQWYYKSVGETKFSLTTSFKSNMYSVSMTEARNGRQLYCVVTDQYGTSVQSETVTISIPDAVKITKQTAVTVAPSGSEASVTVNAVGDGLTYQWYYKNGSNKAFHAATNFTTDTYAVPMTSARNGRQIYCVVTDKYGNTAKSDTFTLYMGNPATITKQPVSVLAPIGKTAKVTVSATGDGLTYQWYYKNADQTKFYLTTKFTTDTYSVSMTEARNGRQIYCVITDKYGTSVKSDVVTLSVPDPVKITQQPESVTVLFGQNATVSVNAVGDGLTYKWYYKNASNKAFHVAADFTTDSYSVPMSTARNGRQLYCVITDKYGNSVKTDVVTIAGVDGLTILEQPQSVKAEKGEQVIVKVVAVGEDLTYKWYYKNTNNSKFYLTTKFTSDTYTVTMDDARNGRQLYCVVTDKDGNSVKTNVVTISIPVKLAITKQPVSVTVLNGDTATVKVGAVGDGLTYQWYYKNANNSKFYLTKKFTTNSYSVTMDDTRNGRQLYCVITDEYGNSVKSNVVTIVGVDQVTITKQPESVTVDGGSMATVTVNAVGKGLTYKWYYKNPDNKVFHLTTKFTGNSYSVEMNSARDGRQVYCVITDQNGNTVRTVTVTLSMVHVHTMSDYVVIREATPEAEGCERSSCDCGYYTDRSIAKVKAVRYITVDLGNGETYKIGVGKNGAYYLTDPYRIGYNFLGWKTAKGTTFASSGTVSANTTIYASWEIDGTDSLAKLIKRAGAGAEEILITADIIVSSPIYVPYQTKIYSDGNYSIIRAPGYTGDIFVVGQNKNGVSSVVENHQAILTLGGGKGTLTIDGNRDNVTKTVVGSAIFAADSCIVNLYDGVRIANHAKLGNQRTYDYAAVIGSYTADRAGGAAILILDSTVNMYGGIIENNMVATEYTEVTNEDGTTSLLENFGCGGAIFNHGNFNMHGGTISSNEGLRGGGIYNGRIVYLNAGTISNNLAHVYGGALASSSSMNADTHIGNDDGSGTMIIKDNHSLRAGGALYSNTSSPIIIYGNTQFIGNVSDTSGGAIYTAGALTIRGTEFIGNSATQYSGGAIYHQYTKAEFSRRYLTVSDCIFEDNFSGLGGAICFSSSSTVGEEGTYATITNCQFLNNKAVKTETNAGNGGALYITRYSDVTITGCTFSGNEANQNSGAVSIHSGATATVTDCVFDDNHANAGGAMYVSSQANVKLKNVDFTNNTAALNENGGGGNGGALYISDSVVTLDDVDMYYNTAGNNAGALYLGACDMTLDDSCEFIGNTAGNHGGVIYVTYKTLEDGTKVGTKLNVNGVTFKDNSALAGGAISARSYSNVKLTDVKFINNSTPGALVGTINGGGAIYSNNSVIELDNVSFDGNCSGYYGGAMKLDVCDAYVYNSSFTNNAGGTGGIIYASNGTFTMDQTTIKDNTSTFNGGIYLTSKEATLTNITATGNYGRFGGVLYASTNSNVTVKNSELSGNSASNGGAVYMAGNATVNFTDTTFANNTTTSHGGAIYVIGSNLNVGSGTTFTGNTAAGNGGAIGAFDKVDETTQEKTGSNVIITGIPFEKNSGSCGGAVYFNDSTYTITDCTFNGNTATSESYGGGAVYNTGATGTIDNVVFTNNTALRGGAMAMYTTSKATVTNVTATGNTATADGGVFFVNSCELELNGEIVLTDNSANYGGALYLHKTDMNLQNVVLKNNTATTNGGSIFVSGAVLNISGSETVISGNSAGGHGGVIYASYTTDSEGVKHGSTVNITGVTLEKNTALVGGAISGRTSSSINLTDVVLQNNGTPDATVENGGGGGAIYTNNSVLTLSNVMLRDNSSGYYGGAIKTEAAHVILKDGTTLDSNSGGTGGAMYLSSGSSLEATDLTVINNVSKANGVIYLNGTNFDITNLTASDNTASWNGGVLYIGGVKTTVTLTDSLLENNSSGTGGAVYMAKGTMTVSQSSISSNSAKSGGAVALINGAQLNLCDTDLNNNSASNGGAVYVAGAVLNVSGDSRFTDNSATAHGGTVYVGDYVPDATEANPNPEAVKATVTIDGAVFTNSTAARGGALYVTGNEYTITNTQFVNNSATDTSYGGGAIYSTQANGNLENVTFTGNTSVKGGAVALHTNSVMSVTSMTATGNSAVVNSEGKLGVGGVFYVNNSTLNLNGTDASVVIGTADGGNTAVNGGAIVAENGAVINITGALFESNSATGNGGAISVSKSEMTIHDVQMLDNSTSVNGGAINISASTVTVTGNSTFTGNTAVGHGGAIYVSYAGSGESRVGGVLNVMDGCFKDNTAMAGGAVSIRSACSATFGATQFYNNSVTGYVDDNDGDGDGGGAIYMGYGALELNNVTAVGNTAEGFGGVITAVGGTVDITNSTFSGNSAMGGGAIHAMSNCHMTITGSNLSENASVYENTDYNNSIGGGAIAIEGGSLTVSDSMLTSNTTGYYGGAIMALGTELTIDQNCVISGSAGSTGAALYIKNSSSVVLNNIAISGNTAKSNGVVYINHSTVTAKELSASGNTAGSGGVFFISGSSSNVTVNESTFADNFAKSGGVLYADSVKVQLVACEITGNTATNGGVSYSKNADVSFDSCNVSSNSATKGGVVFAENGNITLTNGLLNENAADNGGVIYTTGTAVTLNGAVLRSNTASQSAGAVFVKDGSLEIVDGSFESNSATNHAGAVYLNNSTATMSGAAFIGNTAGVNGGAMYISGSEVTGKDDCVFTNNTAVGHGGAIYVVYFTETIDQVEQKIGGTLDLTGGSFTGNTALNGGAISGRTNSVITLTGVLLDGNSTLEASYENGAGGGAIYTNSAVLTLSGCTVSNNVSGYYGGAIKTESTQVTLDNGTILDSNSGGTGGALHLSSSSSLTASDLTVTNNASTANGVLYLNGSTFTFDALTASGNTSDLSGGLMFISGSKTVVSISNSTMELNQADNGGAIYLGNGTLNVSSSTFRKNTAQEGGAICAVSGTATVNGSVFDQNTATNGGAIAVINGAQVNLADSTLESNTATNGGAIYNADAVLNVTGETNFTGNIASGHGGAVYECNYVPKATESDPNPEAVSATVNIDGAVFTGNTALRGGAVYVTSNDYTITNTQFVNNSATDTSYGGGAIYTTQANGNLENVTFTGNTSVKGGAVALHTNSTMTVTSMTATGNSAVANSEGKLGVGGVFYVNNATLNLNGTDASIVIGTAQSGNTAVNGGAIMAENGAVINVSGAQFEGNNATGNGGAIYAGSSCLMSIADSTLSHNNADAYGGAIYASSGSMSINNSVLMNNTATKNGGAIYAGPISVTLSDCSFQNNTAAVNGGAISLSGTTLTGANNSFVGNSAVGHGGAIYNAYQGTGENRIGGVVNFTGGIFQSNTAMAGGAVSIRTSCEATFTGTTFMNNSVTGYADKNDGDADGGGAIYVGFGTVNLTDVIATGNIGESYGGFLDAYSGTVNITGGSYSENSAALGGGAIYALSNSTVTITDATFAQNTTTDKTVQNSIGGGAISIIGGDLTISGSTFDGNGTGYYGGTLLASGTTVSIKGNTVIKNSSGSTGAALYFKNSCEVTLENITISDNPGKGNGVIYLNSGTLNMTNVASNGNTSVNGGVLYISGASTVVNIQNSTFSGNTASNNGGAIYLIGGKMTIIGGELSQNTAKQGGAIYYKSELEIVDVIFTNNESTGDLGGGAIFTEGGTLTASGNNVFTGNIAANAGGAIHAVPLVNTDGSQVAATIVVTGGSFSSNRATVGGAVYAENVTVTVADAVFTANTATNGGAIAVINGAQVNLADSTLESNTATNGGAIYNAGAVLNVTGETNFTGNIATGHGGAVYECNYVPEATESDPNPEAVSATVNIDGAVFTGNTALRGGAVYVTSNDYTITNTQFVNNSATDTSYGGGAIYTTQANGNLENVTFTGNTSVKGGAVALHSKSSMTITSMTATGNSAVANSEGKLGIGGVFYVNNATLNLNGTDASIVIGTAQSGNTAVTGGAIMAENGAVINISGAQFESNSATGNGGAIYAGPITVTLNDCSFQNNTSAINGGAISLSGTTLTGANNSFVGNSAVGHGGAIYNAYQGTGENRISGVVNFTGGIFRSNTAMAGGAVSIRTSCEATFTGTAFMNNSVTGYVDENDGDGDGGGAIYVGYGSVTLNNVTASGNTAETFGGMIDAVSGTVTINGGSYSENSASSGGVIYALNNSQITIIDAVMSSNSSTYVQSGEYNTSMGGGVVNTAGGSLTVSGATFDGNKSGYYGGAILTNGTTVTIDNGTVVKNSVGGTGGALYFKGDSEVTIVNSEILDNKASANGVVYTINGTLEMSNVTASGNSAVSGGVIFNTNTAVTITDSTFTGNTATNGGVIDHRKSNTVNISGSTFSGNSAKLGSVIYMAGTANVTITGSELTGNSATSKGGAIWHGGTGVLTVSEDCVFNSNTAPTAGAIYLDLGATALISDSVFDGNQATGGNGGAILIADSGEDGTAASTLTMTDVELKNNSATGKGGAVSTDDASPNLVINADSCTFIGNSAGAGGGAVEIMHANCNHSEDPTEVTVVFTDCTFTDNIAGTTGGAIEIRSGSCAKINGITATGNKASGNGGVIYVTSENSRLYLTGTVTISDNTVGSSSSGTFIYLYKVNTYTNPPKIYTTDSSSAAWYSEVKGNRTNVAFDLTTLP